MRTAYQCPQSWSWHRVEPTTIVAIQFYFFMLLIGRMKKYHLALHCVAVRTAAATGAGRAFSHRNVVKLSYDRPCTRYHGMCSVACDLVCRIQANDTFIMSLDSCLDDFGWLNDPLRCYIKPKFMVREVDIMFLLLSSTPIHQRFGERVRPPISIAIRHTAVLLLSFCDRFIFAYTYMCIHRVWFAP